MAQWNFNCLNCIYYEPLEACSFTACQFTPIQTVTTNKTQIVETDTVRAVKESKNIKRRREAINGVE
jgi:hypothetical protein